jgi:putative transposase
MRDELLAGEIFYSLKEAQVLIDMWRKRYNTVRPHSALNYQLPTPPALVIPSHQNQHLGQSQNVVQL